MKTQLNSAVIITNEIHRLGTLPKGQSGANLMAWISALLGFEDRWSLHDLPESIRTREVSRKLAMRWLLDP